MKYFFKDRENLIDSLRNKFLFIFLDYDGTLAPIAKVPSKANIPKKTKALIYELAKSPQCRLAVVSGRALKDLKEKVGLKNIIYIGNHGLEIEGPRINFCSSVPSAYMRALKHIKEELNRRISPIKGAFVEDKGLSLSLHFRLVHESKRALVKTIFHEVVILYKVREIIKVKSGKLVLEVRPATDWNKGRVVVWLLARQEFATAGRQVLPIYIGDDLTDEDAFIALKNKGITLFVGEPKDSHARYYLKSVNEVVELLRIILKMKKG